MSAPPPGRPEARRLELPPGLRLGVGQVELWLTGVSAGQGLGPAAERAQPAGPPAGPVPRGDEGAGAEPAAAHGGPPPSAPARGRAPAEQDHPHAAPPPGALAGDPAFAARRPADPVRDHAHAEPEAGGFAGDRASAVPTRGGFAGDLASSVLPVPGPLPVSGLAQGPAPAAPRPADLAQAPDPADLALLDADERARAERLRRPADRLLHVAAHALLRRVLGARLDRDPAGLRFVREPCPGCGGPHGRPALPGAPVHFSLSHSGGLALIALAERPVGVDLELLADAALVTDVAAGLHPYERAALAADPAPSAFTRCWTRKEAYLKGTGEGLTTEGLRDTLVGTGPHPEPVPGWTLADVPVPEGYAAACAVRHTP
ncbi:4'-phosphopantetheinyl transferase family protein [Streptomyces sp. Da 82-17]|uniref:type I polyketide synthase n=1 Tax=Streptomyces sp. Da 82-17 TaxID=3377116 RepID=UPI0038D3D880